MTAKTKPEQVEGGSTWYYCLDPKHPGSKELLDDSRYFQSDAEGCPTCPICEKQVSAVPTDASGVLPSSLLAVAERLI